MRVHQSRPWQWKKGKALTDACLHNREVLIRCIMMQIAACMRRNIEQATLILRIEVRGFSEKSAACEVPGSLRLLQHDLGLGSKDPSFGETAEY